MKTLGLIGGMSWESTLPYYRIINQVVKSRLGGLHSAQLVLYSVDFAQIEKLQMEGDWQRAGELLGQAALSLKAAGAEKLVLCTNTMHKVAAQIEEAAQLPLLHIADATAEVIRASGINRVGLLGTRFTMEQDFYRGRLSQAFGIDVVIPDEPDRADVHRIIYQELCLGVISEDSRRIYRDVMRRLVEQGAEGIILGCTEIGLLVQEADASVPLFDTADLHARAAALWSVES